MRNHVIVLPVDDISNAACEAVAAHIHGTLALPHAYGRLQYGEDLELHFRTMIGTGRNPNVAAAITVSIKCGESETTTGLASCPTVGVVVDRLIDSGADVFLARPPSSRAGST